VTEDCLKDDINYICVGAQYETSKKGIAIAEKFDSGVWASVALHPIHVEGSKFHPEKFDPIEYGRLIESSKKVVAIGETGIDFFHNDDTFTKQKEVFIQHLNLAEEHDLPVIMHGRNSKDGTKSAYKEMVKILKDQKVKGGVIHCFGGSVAEAQGFTDLGFHIGFTGIITFDKTGQLAEVIKSVDLSKILVETDSPYLAPEPNRGKRNQPQYVRYVAEKIAEIRQLSYNKIEKQTSQNTIKLFNL
jgi:TatD DNase family protein